MIKDVHINLLVNIHQEIRYIKIYLIFHLYWIYVLKFYAFLPDIIIPYLNWVLSNILLFSKEVMLIYF